MRKAHSKTAKNPQFQMERFGWHVRARFLHGHLRVACGVSHSHSTLSGFGRTMSPPMTRRAAASLSGHGHPKSASTRCTSLPLVQVILLLLKKYRGLNLSRMASGRAPLVLAGLAVVLMAVPVHAMPWRESQTSVILLGVAVGFVVAFLIYLLLQAVNKTRIVPTYSQVPSLKRFGSLFTESNVAVAGRHILSYTLPAGRPNGG